MQRLKPNIFKLQGLKLDFFHPKQALKLMAWCFTLLSIYNFPHQWGLTLVGTSEDRVTH